MSKNGRVLMAMSGGIDSTMAAIMLHEQGYEVIGITMKTWDYSSSGGSKKETGCCSLDSINDAREVAVHFGFPHYILDIRSEFGDAIIDDFVNEYISGRTPNPCVLCNTHIKWSALWKRAASLKCDHIATGHYARIRKENNRYIISKGKDPLKDQSYVLWGISQENLAKTIFPLSDYVKSDIKKIAVAHGFDSLVNKSESYDICFIPDNDYRGFLTRKVSGLAEKVNGGNFVLSDGKVVGKHKGYPFYTIGQRKGLEIALGDPMYVTKIDPETNTVYIGSENELKEHRMLVRGINLIKYSKIKNPLEVITKIRYHHEGEISTIIQHNDEIEVCFSNPVSAIAPGQSAVFYEENDIVGGGIIQKVIN